MVFDNLEVPTHKTKYIVNYYNETENTKKVLLVDGGPINEKLKLATQNLHYINVLPSIVRSTTQIIPIYQYFWDFVFKEYLTYEKLSSMALIASSLGCLD